MNIKEIKKVKQVGLLLAKKEKPVVKSKGLLFVSGYLSVHGCRVVISDGLLSKQDFLAPCIICKLSKKFSAPEITKIIKKYNTTNKSIGLMEKMSVLHFRDKSIRLSVGKEINKNLKSTIKNMSQVEKKRLMKGYISEFSKLANFLIKEY
ncbi:MAG: hypothetical protein QG583_757 [Patescibacteria group bacterium]|nr:hypothetical protein [Patescibacteria group bacterium]